MLMSVALTLFISCLICGVSVCVHVSPSLSVSPPFEAGGAPPRPPLPAPQHRHGAQGGRGGGAPQEPPADGGE